MADFAEAETEASVVSYLESLHPGGTWPIFGPNNGIFVLKF